MHCSFHSCKFQNVTALITLIQWLTHMTLLRCILCIVWWSLIFTAISESFVPFEFDVTAVTDTNWRCLDSSDSLSWPEKWSIWSTQSDYSNDGFIKLFPFLVGANWGQCHSTPWGNFPGHGRAEHCRMFPGKPLSQSYASFSSWWADYTSRFYLPRNSSSIAAKIPW